MSDTRPGEPLARSDRLDAAGRLLAGLLSFSLALIAALVLAAPLRVALIDDPRPALVRALALTRPALLPAGRPERSPASDPAVEPGFSPGLDRLAPPTASLLLTARIKRPDGLPLRMPPGWDRGISREVKGGKRAGPRANLGASRSRERRLTQRSREVTGPLLPASPRP